MTPSADPRATHAPDRGRALSIAAAALLALSITATRAGARRPWPPMSSSPETLLAPTDLYENARPFRWAGQRRTDSVRVAIMVYRHEGFDPDSPEEHRDSTTMWVMRRDAFGPVNPFLPGRRDPFVVERLLPGGRLALRCQVDLRLPGPDGTLRGARPVGRFVLGRERVRMITPALGGGAEIEMRTVH